jgi:UDP-2-acetamido-2-deoxy-ribo-hexuluronate aminotransferase
LSGSTATSVVDADTSPDPDIDIPFFSQAESFRRHWPTIRANLEQVMDNGKFSHGGQVAEFETALAQYTGARFAVGVNSGTDALVLLLTACGLRPGEPVLVPAYSFVASASSVVLAGGVPRFVDIDPATYAMDPAALAASVTDECRFVMPVHLFHRMADLTAIGEVARRHGLTVVEDSAEAIGMSSGGRHAGLHGAGGVLSFFPSKTLGAIGDAGAVLTDDPEIAGRVAGLRHHGRLGRTMDHFPGISCETELVGVNSKMDDFQAAVLRAKLGTLDADIDRRAALAAAYRDRLLGAPGVLALPRPPDPGGRERGVWYVYLVEVEHRDALAAFLAAQGIGTETYYPVPLHLQPCFAELGCLPGDFPHAEAASTRALALPLYPDLTLAQVDRVCDAVRSFRGAAGR